MIETLASQSQEGQLSPTSTIVRENIINCIKKKLKEAQNVIIELREENRMPEKIIT